MKLIQLVDNFAQKYFRTKIINEKPFVYVALGDSTVEGVGASNKNKSYPSLIHNFIKADHSATKFYNFGQRGATTSDVIHNQLEQTLALKPDLITISIGANDIFHAARVKTFEKRINYILQTLVQNTQAIIVITTIPDFSLVSAFPKVFRKYCELRSRIFNTVIKDSVHDSGVILVDLYSQVKAFGRSHPDLIASDGLHPSDVGYLFWAETITSKLQDML